MSQAMKIKVDATTTVSALWDAPKSFECVLVLAHGAGAGMTHKHMEAIAAGLASRGVATLRYNFAYMERGSGRPDSPRLAQAVVRAAVADGVQRAGRHPVFAGGRSFGGRMTSQAQSEAPLQGVSGLVFFAFPLHPAGKPGIERATHLARVDLPMLFLQGTEDDLAQTLLLNGVVAELGERATLSLVQHADHSFHVPARSGRKDAEVLAGILDAAKDWMLRVA